MTQTILIAGGGITGLTAAYYLQKRARATGRSPKIILVEQAERLGGKVKTEVISGMVVEGGPDSYVTHKPWLKALCGELGLPQTGTAPGIEKTYVLRQGRIESLPAGMRLMVPTEILPFALSPLLSPLGKVRAVLEPFVPAKRSDVDESIGSFIHRRFGREVLEKIAGPLMAGIHGGDWNEISLKATFPQFMQTEREKGSLLLSARKQGARAGRSGSLFETLPTGMESLIGELVKACDGVEFFTGTALSGLRQGAGGKGFTADLDGRDQLPADAVVLTLPAYRSGALVRDMLPQASAELDRIPYASSVVAVVAFHRSDVPHPLDGAGFVVPRSEPLELTACTWVSSKWAHAAPPDKVLFRCFLGRSGGSDWTSAADDEIVRVVRRELERVMGLKSAPILTRIFRYPKAMPQYRVDHLDLVDRIDRLVVQLPGLVLAGSAFRGVGLPDCAREGETAAARVAEHLGW